MHSSCLRGTSRVWEADAMAVNSPGAPGDDAGGAGRGPHLLLGRALIVLVIAVALGVVLLQVGSRGPVISGGSVSTTSTTAIPGHSSTTTSTTMIARSSVT